MNQLNEIQKLKTIVLSEENYQKLKRMGSIGESFNDVISRLLQKGKTQSQSYHQVLWLR